MGSETQPEMNPLLEIPALRLTSEVTSGQIFNALNKLIFLKDHKSEYINNNRTKFIVLFLLFFLLF